MDDLQSVLGDARFSREVQLSNVGGLETCRVKYADFGHRNDPPGQENVLLFMGPLFGTRWIHVFKDELAKQHKIRMIMIDRPGFGGTDAVDIKQRLETTRGKPLVLRSRAPR
jgi:pimeloyl-ACP methyl ester carboxylesterase